MRLNLDWTDLKSIIDDNDLFYSHIELSSKYYVYVEFNNLLLSCIIDKDSGSDQSDYESNYKSSANVNLDPKDVDGASLSRVKSTKTGWHYQPHWVEITTSKYSSGFYNKDENGNDLGFVTYKIYDNTNTEITSGANEGNAVKTVVTWQPTHDYEIIAAKIFQNTPPTTDVRIWVTGVPDLPAQYGGSKIFAQGGINLKLLGEGSAADTDGRTSKYLQYSGAPYYTNKFKIVAKHEAGVQQTFSMMFEIYKA